MRRLLAPVVLLTALCLATPAAAAVPEGAVWSEAYIDAPDGTKLHVDVLRPKGLPKDARTPVVLTASPYLNHATQNGADADPSAEPPSERFKDFYDGVKLFQRGYTYVLGDLRGFGGSGGCNDWGGPGEQQDVKAMVEWAASQPWSTGKVALYGKSYDAWTGLMGLVQKPKGLAAVVAMEPVYDGYDYLYTNGIRFTNSVATPTLFSAIDAAPGTANDSPDYHLNGTSPNAPCYALNISNQQADDPAAEFWKVRDLVPRAKGSNVPLLMMQGFLEDNTKPEAAFEFFNATTGPKRAWFGHWDHIRGNEAAVGRAPRIWFDQVGRFLDHYVRDVPLADAAVDKDPPVELQGSDGSWRAEQAWPPLDTRDLTTQLKNGVYTDDGQNNGTNATPGNEGDGLWTISPPLPHRAHLAGVPRLTAELSPVTPRANLVANLYDIAKDGRATMVSRGAHLLRAGGRLSFELYGADWTFEAGHRVGVLLSSSNAEWWVHTPTNGPVTVNSARISLPFLQHTRGAALEGKAPDKLTAYKAEAPFPVAEETIKSATLDGFALPGPLTAPPAPAAAPAVPVARGAKRRLVARIAATRRRVTVFGTAPSGSRVTVVLRRGTRAVVRRRTVARLGAFRVTFRVRRAGRYRADVSASAGRELLRARTARKRVR